MGKRKPFKFINVLTKIPQFMSKIGEFWENMDSMCIDVGFVPILKKIKSLKPLLRALGKDKLWDLPRRTGEAHEVLCSKQAETLLNHHRLIWRKKKKSI